MRILIATPLFPPDIGGPATHARTLFEQLPERGFTVSVLSFGDVRHLPKGIRHIAYLVRLLQYGHKADVLYALDPVSVGLPTSVAAFVLKKKFVVRIAGDYAWEQGTERFGITQSFEAFLKKTDRHPPFVKMLSLLERWVARRACKIVVPSEYLRDRLVQGWDLPKKDIIVAYNGVEASFETGNRRTLRALLKVKGKVILSASRLIPLKNFEDIILATGSLKKDIPELKLVIAGDGPHKERLERLIAGHKLEDTVVLTGRLERDVLFRYVSISDVFVLNSWHETFSHLLLEVMAIGVPVVATEVGGTPEVITDDKEGLLIPPKNRKELEQVLRSLLTSPQKGRRLVRAAKERIQKFSKEKEISSLVNVFSDL